MTDDKTEKPLNLFQKLLKKAEEHNDEQTLSEEINKDMQRSAKVWGQLKNEVILVDLFDNYQSLNQRLQEAEVRVREKEKYVKMMTNMIVKELESGIADDDYLIADKLNKDLANLENSLKNEKDDYIKLYQTYLKYVDTVGVKETVTNQKPQDSDPSKIIANQFARALATALNNRPNKNEIIDIHENKNSKLNDDLDNSDLLISSAFE